jgi:small-conductance mechanosensitive channel
MKKLFVFFLIVCFSKAGFCQTDSIQEANISSHVALRKTFTPEPVAPFRDTLFYFGAGIGSFTPKERAIAVTERIRNFNKEFGRIQSDSLKVFVDANYCYIAYNDFIILTITETDAQILGKEQLLLASECKTIIQNAIIQYEKDTYWLNILWRIFLLFVIVAALFFLIKLINFAFGKLSIKIEKLKGTKIKTISIKSFRLMNEDGATQFILFLVKIIRIFVILFTIYLSLPLLFSVFPATRKIATILFGYVWTPLKGMLASIVDFIPNLISIIIIVVIFRYILKGLRFVALEIRRKKLKIKGFYPDWALPTFNIIRVLLYAFMFILIFPKLPNSGSPIFQGVSVFIGVIFSLGSTTVINNIMSGLVLTYMRPFTIGDRIKIGDVVGNVIEKTPFVVRLRTPKNEEVTIPNSGVMTAQTFNYSESARTHKLILHTEVTFGYDTPWRKIHELLLNVAKRTEYVLENPKPFILQTALDDFYVEYQLNVYVIEADKMAGIYSELRQNIQDVFREADIEIMSPHYRAYRDGGKSTVPIE